MNNERTELFELYYIYADFEEQTCSFHRHIYTYVIDVWVENWLTVN